MSDAVVWGLVALMLPPQMVMVGLSYAPKSFWRGLSTEHRGAAHWLWGFSHPFGPLSRSGQPAWELLPDESPS